MTRDEILNLPAGRELDALISVQLFGVREFLDEDDAYYLGENQMPVRLPDYSTDIAAAWEVVEKLKNVSGATIGVRVHPTAGYSINVYQLGMNYWPTADTAPLAICRAALLVVGFKK